MKARIIIGANYGDEGKGTVVANYTKNSKNVLNVLTNGGAQRGHSILTKEGSVTFQHFGSGTYHGADSYYSCFFILNPMQFVQEYNNLVIKPEHIYRDKYCRWSTPYDSLANLIKESSLKRKASCCMGVWNTIKRHSIEVEKGINVLFDDFINSDNCIRYLDYIKVYYEKELDIPSNMKSIWNSEYLKLHFIEDCKFMYNHTKVVDLSELNYDNLIFENGQGLLLCDTGKDTYDTTPSNTGIAYAAALLKGLNVDEVIAHYVTRPYLTRHGDGYIDRVRRYDLSSNVLEDRTNHYNDFQGEFRYGKLDISELYDRILEDSGNIKFELEVTHCDEMDRISEFKRKFKTINTYDTPLV